MYVSAFLSVLFLWVDISSNYSVSEIMETAYFLQVKEDVRQNYYATSLFLDKVLDIYLTASAMEWLSMDEIDSAPTLPLETGNLAVKNRSKTFQKQIQHNNLVKWRTNHY